MAGIRPERLSVSKIKSRLLHVAQSSLYRLTLSIPQEVRNNLTSFSRTDYDNINLLCSEATLPGSTLNTHEVNNDYHGVTEKMAYRRMYDETVGLAFYVDRDYKVVEMLEAWMDYISGMENKGAYKTPYISNRMAYPESYKRNIFLTKFEKDHFDDYRVTSPVLDYTFVSAWPLAFTAIPVSYEGSQVLKCNVSFNFVRYVVEKNLVSYGSLEHFTNSQAGLRAQAALAALEDK